MILSKFNKLNIKYGDLFLKYDIIYTYNLQKGEQPQNAKF